MADESRQFTTWDWVLFATMLVISAGIGIFYAFKGKKQKTTGDFLMGGRNMQLFPVAISILVSFMSAILILGTPAEMYTQGTLYFLYLLGMIISIILSAQMFVPLLYPLKLTSSFEVSDLLSLMELCHDNNVLIAYADIEGPDQSALPCLRCSFTEILANVEYLLLYMDSKGSDQAPSI